MASSRAATIPTALELYEEYAYASPKVTFQMVDPDRNPELAERYKVSALGTTHLQYGGDESGNGTNVNELTEEAITNAIIRVTKSTKKTICFTDGHGEGDPDDAQGQNGYGTLKTALEGEGFADQENFARDPGRGARRLHHPRDCRPGEAARSA